jgi:hypothetical protein
MNVFSPTVRKTRLYLLFRRPGRWKTQRRRQTRHIRLEFFMDLDIPASKCLRHFVIFKDGCAEDCIKWLIEYREIEKLMPIRKAADKCKMLRTLLKGKALSHFDHHLRKRLDTDDAELPENYLMNWFFVIWV